MKLVSISEVPAIGTAVSGGVVFIPVMDAQFLFHAFNELRKSMPEISNAIYGVVEEKKVIDDFNRCANILHAMEGVLLPVATEIVVPKTEIDLECYKPAPTDDADLNAGRAIAKAKWGNKSVAQEVEVDPDYKMKG